MSTLPLLTELRRKGIKLSHVTSSHAVMNQIGLTNQSKPRHSTNSLCQVFSEGFLAFINVLERMKVHDLKIYNRNKCDSAGLQPSAAVPRVATSKINCRSAVLEVGYPVLTVLPFEMY